jgi:hypothetical protein
METNDATTWVDSRRNERSAIAVIGSASVFGQLRYKRPSRRIPEVFFD